MYARVYSECTLSLLENMQKISEDTVHYSGHLQGELRGIRRGIAPEQSKNTQSVLSYVISFLSVYQNAFDGK